MEAPHAGRRVGTRRPVRQSVVVVLIALALRLVPVAFHRFHPERVLTLDSPLYLELGWNLREHGAFRRTGPERGAAVENPGAVEVFRTPGYPLLLALLGRTPQRVAVAAICAQIVLDALAAGLIVGIAGTVMPRRWALIAGLLAAVDVGHIVYANLVMSDTVFAALLMAGVWLLVRPTEKRSFSSRLIAGLAFSAAAAVRPVGVMASVAGAVFLVARREDRRRIAVFLLAALAFPVGWTFRNGMGAGVWSVSDAGGYNLCVVAGAKVKAAAEGITRSEAERRLVEQVLRESPGDDSARRSAAFRRVGWQVISAHPSAAAKEAVVSLAEFALAGERRYLLRLFGADTETSAGVDEGDRNPRAFLSGLARRERVELLVVLGQAGWNLLLWLAAFVGAVQLARRSRWAELLLFATAIGYQTAASFVVAHGRMRVPIVGMLAVMAALGLSRVIRRRNVGDGQATTRV